jgi:hypothetical protein
LPPAEVTPRVYPAHNGEALTVSLGTRTRRQAAGNAVGSPLPLRRHGPVTTDPFGVRLGSCQTRTVTFGYGKSTARAIRGLSTRLSGSPVVHLRIRRRRGMLHGFDFASADALVGWEVRPSVSVSQNGDRSEVLLEIQRYFGCGNLRPDRSDRTLKWEVRSLPVLLERVIPHFRRYPLRSGKQRDFELFADICQRMARGEHRGVVGFGEIVRLAGRMNPSGKRRFLPESILQSLVEMKA